jgi:hypothetical protein
MANNNIASPGIYFNENDQSFLPQGVIEAGGAIVGPTVKGPVNRPTLVTSYNDYVSKFGSVLESGSDGNKQQYSFFTSTAAYNYFNNGGNTLLVSRVVSGAYSAASASVEGLSTLGGSQSFKLNTLAEGAEQNSTGSENSGGLLESGSINNIRWEIQNANTESGRFNLLIRRGDDSADNKVVLEQFNNVSLDPFDPNFIGSAVGTQRTELKGSGADVYLETVGDFPNISRYVYVTDINETPSYTDAEGNVRVGSTSGSIPADGSGSFEGAQGTIVAGAKFGADIEDDNIQGVGGDDYTASFYLLNDPNYTYTSIVAPGLNYTGHSSQLNILLNNVKDRADALAVIDLQDYADGASVSGLATQAKSINNSYAAAYAPWLLSKDPVTGRQVWSPASTFIPGVYAYNDKVGEPWFAPAGLNRGSLPTVLKTQKGFAKADRDTLYDAKVNPIAVFPRSGVVVFGQKTLQTKASALDRINVRRLLITVKQFLDQQAGNVVFEQNTTATRNNFLAVINPYLESVQQRQGLYAFKVVMDESINTPAVIDRNELVGQIYLQPTKTAEFIILNFNVQPTGATFPES